MQIFVWLRRVAGRGFRMFFGFKGLFKVWGLLRFIVWCSVAGAVDDDFGCQVVTPHCHCSLCGGFRQRGRRLNLPMPGCNSSTRFRQGPSRYSHATSKSQRERPATMPGMPRIRKTGQKAQLERTTQNDILDPTSEADNH